MTITNAAELHTTWAARFNTQDLDGMIALAEVASVFVPQPGVVVEGEGGAGGRAAVLEAGCADCA